LSTRCNTSESARKNPCGLTAHGLGVFWRYAERLGPVGSGPELCSVRGGIRGTHCVNLLRHDLEVVDLHGCLTSYDGWLSRNVRFFSKGFRRIGVCAIAAHERSSEAGQEQFPANTRLVHSTPHEVCVERATTAARVALLLLGNLYEIPAGVIKD